MNDYVNKLFNEDILTYRQFVLYLLLICIILKSWQSFYQNAQKQWIFKIHYIYMKKK